jgi:hypothetical protein
MGTERLSSSLRLAAPSANIILAKEDLERFSVYNFAIDYPAVCRVEFNPKSRREKGDVVFHFPDSEKLFLSWGDLETARKKFHTVEEQAEHSVDALSKNSNVKNSERVARDLLKINSHKAAYNRVRLDELQAGLSLRKKAVKHEVYSVHLHCDELDRYFVIYAMLSPNAPEDFVDLFLRMANSFECH